MSIFNTAATSAINSAASQFIPSHLNKAVNMAEKVGGQVASGNIQGAANSVLGSGLLDGALGGFAGGIKQAIYWGTETPMYGGITPARAKEIHQESLGVDLAKKNLFILEVGSLLYGDISDRFNLLASEVEFAPTTVTAEKRKVGGATVDSVQSAEPIDLSITTLDDKQGYIKNWFRDHIEAVAHSDGTIGLPFMYAIRIKIVHAFIENPRGAYEDLGLFRPTNMNINLTRREDGLQELALTFSQLDTFMAP
jgi:hypothetical protein